MGDKPKTEGCAVGFVGLFRKDCGVGNRPSTAGCAVGFVVMFRRDSGRQAKAIQVGAQTAVSNAWLEKSGLLMAQQARRLVIRWHTVHLYPLLLTINCCATVYKGRMCGFTGY